MNDILAIPRHTCSELPESGAWPWAEWSWPSHLQWLPRPRAEHDEDYLQIIPYAVIENPAGQVWCYRRSGGDARLVERLSCGVGGHVDSADAEADFRATIRKALRREIAEELDWALPPDPALDPICGIYEGLSPIGRVHLGLVFELIWPHSEPPVPPSGESLDSLGFLDRSAILGDNRFELWSRLALQGIEANRP
jgi:predicted NUDIX family phosphoesterase